MDVEKAIDLLDNLIGMVEDNQGNDYDEALKFAIQTIRELQSKSEEVCKWKYETLIKFASSNCGGFDAQRIDFDKFKYCPYCGRKIKVVE